MSRIVRSDRPLVGLLALALAVLAGPAMGTDYLWMAPVDGVFGDPSKWSPPGPPGVADVAVFDLPAAYAVTFDGEYTNDRLLLGQGEVTFDLAGNTYHLLHGWDGLGTVSVGDTIGVQTSARLTVTNGTVDAKEVELARWSENTGEMVISRGAHWTGFMHSFMVGVLGQGRVTVEAGGVLEFGAGQLAQQADSTGVVHVTGPGSLWNVTGYFALADRGRGTMTVDGGASARFGRCELAVNAGSSAVVTVDGPGSVLRCYAPGEISLAVGTQGSASLLVQNGGMLDNGHHLSIGRYLGSTGVVTVSGAGALLDCGGVLTAGDNGTGYLTVAAGGRVVIEQDFHVGFAGRGSVTITGAGSSIDCVGWGGVFVGYGAGGNGSLAITDGAVLRNVAGHVAVSEPAEGTVLVDGAGSAWVNSGPLLVGGTGEPGGKATLTIRNGGRVSAGDGTTVWSEGTIQLAGGLLEGGDVVNLGLIAGHGELAAGLDGNSTGEIRVEQGERLLLSGAGGGHRGRMNLRGGTMEFTQPLDNSTQGEILGRGTLILREGLDNHGKIGLSNGTTDVVGEVRNTGTGRIIVSGRADVTFWDDVDNHGDEFKVAPDSSATFFGAYSGGDVTGTGHVYFEGPVAPGASPAAVTFGGSVSFSPTARLEIELGGTGHGEFDRLTVDRDVRLGGTLAVALWGRFAPDYGTEFELLSGASVAGRFDELTGSDLTENLYLAVLYDANSVRAVAAIPGDADLDGDVDFRDYLAVKRGFGDAGEWPDGDFHGDGQVDIKDYAVGQEHYGWPLGWAVPPAEGAAGGRAVPAPATLLLLAAAAPAVLRRRRRPRNG